MPPFRFFDLPRELRNLVLEHAIRNVHHRPGASHNETHMYLQNVLDTNILLVNRQMNLEYREQLADRTYLLVHGSRYDYWSDFGWPSKPVRERIKHSTIYAHIVCFCDFMTEGDHTEFLGPCDGADGLQSYYTDLDGLMMHMSQVGSAHLKIALWCAPDVEYEKADAGSQEPPKLLHTLDFKDRLMDLTAIPLMKSIEIARCTNDAEYDKYCWGKILPIIATWTPMDGWRSKWK